jgi:hypothetical protein
VISFFYILKFGADDGKDENDDVLPSMIFQELVRLFPRDPDYWRVSVFKSMILDHEYMASGVHLSDEIEPELKDLVKYMTDKGVTNVSQEQMLSTSIEHGIECEDTRLAKFLREPEETDWESDPMFGIKVRAGADASMSVDRDVHAEYHAFFNS